MSKLQDFFQFQRNYNLHKNGDDFSSEDYNCDRNIFDCSSSVQEALLLNNLLTNAYAVSGFGESYLIQYLNAYISKEEMYRLLILASDPEVRDLRLKRDKRKNHRVIRNKINKNLVHARASEFVFGCDDNGRIEFPETPEEYIEAYKEKGFVFSSEEFEITYHNGDWHFDKVAPIVSAYPKEFVNELLREYANPSNRIAYFV